MGVTSCPGCEWRSWETSCCIKASARVRIFRCCKTVLRESFIASGPGPARGEFFDILLVTKVPSKKFLHLILKPKVELSFWWMFGGVLVEC